MNATSYPTHLDCQEKPPNRGDVCARPRSWGSGDGSSPHFGGFTLPAHPCVIALAEPALENRPGTLDLGASTLMKESRRVLVGLGAGLVLGLTIASRHNSTLVGMVDAVAPAGTLWVNAIRMTIIPLVVSLVITGVASTSNVGAISRIGGRTLLVFFAMLAGATALAIPLGIAAFSWLSRLVTVRPGLPPALPRPRRPWPPVPIRSAFGTGFSR